MALAENEFARRDADGVEIRQSPARLAWSLDGLTTSDSHALRGRFACSAQIADNPTDRRAFAEVILAGHRSVTIADLCGHFAAALHKAAADAARQAPAEEWTGGANEKPMLDALLAAGKRLAFACGLELLPPFHLELDSPSLQQSRREQIERARAEQRAAGQVEHLKRA